MEESQRIAPDIGDVSDAKREEVEVEEVVGEEAPEERLLRVVARLGGRAKIEFPMYEGNLYVEYLLDWIISMDRHFDYEDVNVEKKEKQEITRLKGHSVLRWDEL
jgi:hypothetical protein